MIYCYCCRLFFFFKQKTAYEMRISDWSSDVCSSDLATSHPDFEQFLACFGIMDKIGMARCLIQIERFNILRDGADKALPQRKLGDMHRFLQIGRASCRERVCQYV